MPNKIIKTEDGVSVRIDGVYTTNEKHLVTPFTNKDGKERFFGSFKFDNYSEAKETLKEAVKQVGAKYDTIFSGTYPKIVTDNYGTALKIGNRVKFYKDVSSKEEVPDLYIRDFTYSIELHLSKTKKDEIFLRCPRAIVMGTKEPKHNDDLYETDGLEVSDDDMPF